MSTAEFVGAMIIGIGGGGYIGVALDRYLRRSPEGVLPPRYVSEARLAKMHIIRDEFGAGSSVTIRRPRRPDTGV